MSEHHTQGNGSEVAVRHVDVPLDYTVLEHVLGTGDLSKLTIQQRVQYYRSTCESLGLDFRTRPFRFMSFQGQTVMYATRDAADQLRNVRKISLQVVDQKLDGELFIVTVRATDPHGRTDEDMGAVTMGQLKGEARANAILKAITKAKRRVTLSICGLGFNDETEVETLHGAQTYDVEEEPPAPSPPTRRVETPPPQPTEKPKRTFATLLDEIESAAKAATTEEDLDALLRDDRTRFINEKGSEAVKERLQRTLDQERERVQAFWQMPTHEDDPPLDEALPPEMQAAQPAPSDAATPLIVRVQTMDMAALNKLDSSAEFRAECKGLDKPAYDRLRAAIDDRVAMLRAGA